jgi:hypothetical protein
MLFYVIRSYLRDHPEIAESLRELRIVALLRALLGLLRRGITGAVRTVRDLTARDTASGKERRGPLRLRRITAQSPRDRILYYYLNTLRRASQLGVGRRGSQTPHEYGLVLGPMLADSHPALESLTESFVEARYSRHEVDRDQERQVRGIWRQVTGALKELRRALSAAQGD